MDTYSAESKAEQPRRQRGKSPYFVKPAKQGAVMVFHRACGNRAEPKLCGTMPSRGLANALIAQLSRAESAVDDLFLEATDDGIEALEAILQACCESVLSRGSAPREGRRRRRSRRSSPPTDN